MIMHACIQSATLYSLCLLAYLCVCACMHECAILLQARKWLRRVVCEHKLPVFVGKINFDCKEGESEKQV